MTEHPTCVDCGATLPESVSRCPICSAYQTRGDLEREARQSVANAARMREQLDAITRICEYGPPIGSPAERQEEWRWRVEQIRLTARGQG